MFPHDRPLSEVEFVADWRRCRNLGITAVPTFVVGDDGVVGAQPYEVLETLVVEGGAAKR